MSDVSIYQELVAVNKKELSRYLSVDNSEIYHYTSPLGLNGIMSNNTLRFTDRNYLNDYSEGRYVIKLCLNSRFELKLPEEYRPYFRKYCRTLYNTPAMKKRYIYQCSFSVHKDNLSLWNYYTKSDGMKGYNIGFNAEELSKKLVTRSSTEKSGITIYHSKVVYSKKHQKSIIKKIVDDFKDIIEKNRTNEAFCKIAIEVLVEKILFVGSFFKDSHFEHEDEYRLLIHLTPYWDTAEKQMKFMVLHDCAKTYEKNGLLIPYVDLEFRNEVLKSISASPTLQLDEIESNLINALKIHGYNADAIKIKKSNIPVRY